MLTHEKTKAICALEFSFEIGSSALLVQAAVKLVKSQVAATPLNSVKIR